MVCVGDEEPPIRREGDRAQSRVRLDEVERGGAARLQGLCNRAIGVEDDESTGWGVGDPNPPIRSDIREEQRRHPEILCGPSPDLVEWRD